MRIGRRIWGRRTNKISRKDAKTNTKNAKKEIGLQSFAESVDDSGDSVFDQIDIEVD